jgi:sporulation protein YlmC with PRC-barrel domain
MALYSNLRDYQFGDATENDIRGAKIFDANQEKLGEINDVIFDTKTGEVRYVVVNSGRLTAFVVPTRQLMIREEGDQDFHISLTKEQVESLPQYNEKDLESDERWSNYESRYEAAWVADPVLHREGSTHTITPDPDQMPLEGKGTPLQSREQLERATPRRIAHDLPRFGATSDTEHAERTGNLVGETELEPVDTEYKGVDAYIPLQVSEEPVPLIGSESRAARRYQQFQERVGKEREEILRRRQSGKSKTEGRVA